MKEIELMGITILTWVGLENEVLVIPPKRFEETVEEWTERCVLIKFEEKKNETKESIQV